ncbi:MAG: ATP-dependent helicase [Anaerolineales bacterium]
MTDFTPRPSQQTILTYTGGTLGISAVPGSGKTHILSALAAQIIAGGALDVDQEVLIVTLVNSAVDNFSQRIGGFMQQRGLIPRVGYRVRTLHGLAHDIVRENPSLVGLDSRFAIVDEREAEFIRKEAAQAWLAAHPYTLEDYFDPNMDDSKRDWVRRGQLPELLNGIALAFIRSAKDHRQTPESLRARLDSAPAPLPLAEMGWDIYSNYQRALTYRGAVDFDDLIRLALEALTVSPELLERLRRRFPYILEDEAQDSSALQEQILGKLSSGNWVRVGDPNQAIFETFTTAKPEYLLRFIEAADFKQDLPVSGRSQPAIIALANNLIDWVRNDHPLPESRNALTVPYIQAAAADDPQPNPADDPEAIKLIGNKYTPDEEVEAVVKSIQKWLPDHLDQTVAVLVPRNARGVDVIAKLKERKIEYVEYLSSTSTTRAAAGALGNVSAYLADPSSAPKLARAYQVWRRQWREEDAQKAFYAHITDLIRKCAQVESFLAPRPDKDWLATLGRGEPLGGDAGSDNGIQDTGSPDAEAVLAELEEFRGIVRRWQGATMLPIDQMILTLAQDLFTEPADLALAHKLALVLRQAADDHADWRLPELTTELGVIAKNERRFLGFSADDSGFDPARHRGKVVVATMHKAKGLEWDRVYLMSVNNYDFPSGMANDRYISEKWFVRDGLNLEAETLAQLQNALSSGEYDWQAEGEATLRARIDYVRERLRLLYVGLTRAKRDLIVTWNTGRTGEQTQAIAFAALQGFQGLGRETQA